MPIHYNKNSQTIHLYNNHISYIIKILDNKQLGQLYFGKRIHLKENYDYLLEHAHRPMSACYQVGDLTKSLEHIKQEYPAYFMGDMKDGAFDIETKDGSRLSEFYYLKHNIYQGKHHIPGLPATYGNDISTLEIQLHDDIMNCTMTLYYSLFEHLGAIARHVSIKNNSHEDIKIHKIMSMNLDLPDSDYTLTHLDGAWSRERHIHTHPLHHGIQSIYSLRGHSSHQFNPFFYLEKKDNVYGFGFVYSGNFSGSVDVDQYHTSRIQFGIHPETFDWLLKPEEEFHTPEVLIVYANSQTEMSQTFHQIIQNHLTPGKYAHQVRPILVNNWEGTYFDFNEDKIVSMAKTAKDLGIELFVLDDGWFGKRNDDKAGLGDWYVNLEKLPNGISGLSKRINELGLKFGLWFEPEMVNLDSNLYRAHPNWVIGHQNRPHSHGRNQYVLNYANKEVVDYIYTMMCDILDDASISYIKWDMNRSISEAYNHFVSPHEQGKFYHQYILGVYDLYERLISRYPDILFESCASGGGHFDLGMLYYAPQTWTSDNTDAIERLKIQYGTSLIYPLSSIGSHVSAIPNHQVKRNVPLYTRANVAYFGTFGYELDVNSLNEKEKEDIKKQIAFMKEYREVIQFGKFYHLLSPFQTNNTAWMVVSKDQKTAIVGYYRPLQEVNVGYRRIQLLGLNPDMLYTIDNHKYYGDELMHIGLINSDDSCGENHGTIGDYYSKIYILKGE